MQYLAGAAVASHRRIDAMCGAAALFNLLRLGALKIKATALVTS